MGAIRVGLLLYGSRASDPAAADARLLTASGRCDSLLRRQPDARGRCADSSPRRMVTISVRALLAVLARRIGDTQHLTQKVAEEEHASSGRPEGTTEAGEDQTHDREK